MDFTLEIGGTREATTPLVLKDVGNGTVGEREYRLPTSTLTTPRIVKIKSIAPVTTSANPGKSKTTVRVLLGNRVTDENCCSVTPGTVIVDLSVDWPLTQPVALIDDVISILQGLAYSDELPELLKQGILP